MTLKSFLPSTWTHRDDGDVFRSLHTAVDKVFEDFMELSPRKVSPENLFDFSSFGYNYPKIDVSEIDDKVEVEVELPGIEQKDVDVTLDGQLLVIKGESESEEKSEKKNYRTVERSRGSFKRAIPLGFEANPDTVEASFSKGVLTVTIAKPAEVVAKVKKIEVKEPESA